MTLSEELDALYIDIGSVGAEITDAKLARIWQLEDLLVPIAVETGKGSDEIGCGCGDPNHCWECAAIRGGCPEDV